MNLAKLCGVAERLHKAKSKKQQKRREKLQEKKKQGSQHKCMFSLLFGKVVAHINQFVLT